jgi:transcription elongation factor GreB
MSRAFVKDDASDEPPIVPPRAPLPPGVPNYVTPRGLALLRAEWAMLDAERARLNADAREEAERQRQLAVVNQRLADLNMRLAQASVVDPARQDQAEVRFGATVTVRSADGERRTFTLVGVDEADAAEGRLAFTAPLARAVLGHRVGAEVVLRTPRGEEVLAIQEVRYETA